MCALHKGRRFSLLFFIFFPVIASFVPCYPKSRKRIKHLKIQRLLKVTRLRQRVFPIFPCIFPCYGLILARDWFARHCAPSHPATAAAMISGSHQNHRDLSERCRCLTPCRDAHQRPVLPFTAEVEALVSGPASAISGEMPMQVGD